MGSNATPGVGAKFRKWNGSNWVDLAEVLSINGPGMTRDFIDVTSLDSIGGYKEYIGSFRDGGTVTLSMNFTRANYELMKEDFESNDVQNYEIFLPDTEATSLEFEGFVTELPLSVTVTEQIKMDVTIKVTGEPVLNSGSGSGAV